MLRGIARPASLPRRTRLTAWIAIGGSAAAIPILIAVYKAIGRKKSEIFREHAPASLLIVAILLASAVGAIKVMRRVPRERFVRLFWGVFASLLVFAMLDDVLRIHEQADRLINRYFGHDPDDPLYDRLDDLIVAAYVTIGFGGTALLVFDHLLALSWACRFFGVGAVLFVGMVLGDTFHWGIMLEDTMKLLSAACIFSGIAAAEHQIADERRAGRLGP